MDENEDFEAVLDDSVPDLDSERLTWELSLRAWLLVRQDELTTQDA